MRGGCIALTASAVSIAVVASISIAAQTNSNDPAAVQPARDSDLAARFGQQVLHEQREFLGRMSGVEIRYGPNGAISRLVGRTGIMLQVRGSDLRTGQAAPEILAKLAPALLAAGTEELRVWHVPRSQADSGTQTAKMTQHIRGLEVLLGWVNVRFDVNTGEIDTVAANFLPDRGLETTPNLGADEAKSRLKQNMLDGTADGTVVTLSDTPPRLAYAFQEIGDEGGRGGVLVWVIGVSRTRDGRPEDYEASVSAATGEVVRLRATTLPALNRISYTAGYTSPPPGGFPLGLKLRTWILDTPTVRVYS